MQGPCFFRFPQIASPQMSETTHGISRSWRPLVLSQFLAIALLAGCLWWIYREFALSFTNHPILPSLTVQEHLGSMLTRQLAAFGAAALLVHALLGLAAFGLARPVLGRNGLVALPPLAFGLGLDPLAGGALLALVTLDRLGRCAPCVVVAATTSKDWHGWAPVIGYAPCL